MNLNERLVKMTKDKILHYVSCREKQLYSNLVECEEKYGVDSPIAAMVNAKWSEMYDLCKLLKLL